jgi:hypothetical protein
MSVYLKPGCKRRLLLQIGNVGSLVVDVVLVSDVVELELRTGV